MNQTSKLKTKVATVERVCRELEKTAPLKSVPPGEHQFNRGYRQALIDVVHEVRAEAACGR